MLKKRLIIMLVTVVIAAVGGYVAWQLVQNTQRQQAYEASSDKVADDFVRALTSQDVKAAMQLFSVELEANYSEKYWQGVVFDKLRGFTGSPTLKSKGPVQPLSSDEPNRYDPQLKQGAMQYDYDFKLTTATYRVSIVVFRQSDVWKINEIHGGYLP